MVPVDREPRDGQKAPTLAALRAEVVAHPDERAKRLALVRGLVAKKDLDGALEAARAWRAKDAYNLVAC